MNWLAHLYLSEPDARFRVGNLLPDLASRAELADLPESYQQGMRCHRAIDSFADTHPRFMACVRRFPSPYRRFGGILTDVYFDHFLARDWRSYSPIPLPESIREFHGDIATCLPEIPSKAAWVLRRMREENWLGSYHTKPGVADILRRISHRLRRPFDLSGSLPFFEEQEPAFQEDFRAFFPELQEHVAKQAQARGNVPCWN